MPRTFSSPGAFADFLESLGPRLREAQEGGLTEAARLIQHEAREEIGNYQEAAGPFQYWPQLAPSTINEKERLGYAPPDNPLLREGDLRESIGYVVEGNEAAIGSASDIALWQELGTERIPPRSFFGRAGFVKGAEAVSAIAARILGVFTR